VDEERIVRSIVGLVAMQTDPALLDSVQRIAWSQIIMAALMSLAFLIVIGAGVFTIRLIRKAQASIQPTIDRVNAIAADAGAVSDQVKEQVETLLETVQQANDRLRQAVHAAELRVRDFGAVLDAVQGETEDVLLDTAATARGVHVAAETLTQTRKIGRSRGPAASPPGPPAIDLGAPVARKELGG
jgi:hypothetical protein